MSRSLVVLYILMMVIGFGTAMVLAAR